MRIGMVQKLGLIALTSLLFVAPVHASTLWYNGDFNGAGGLSNEINTEVTDSMIFDDFRVSGGGWNVNQVWTNNLITPFFDITQARWEIRSGVATNNGGTLVASGTGAATQVATGRTGFGYTEYSIAVSGLNTYLSPGTYWLAVAPIGYGTRRSYDSTTSGLNAIGSPAGDNGNAFINSAYFHSNFLPTTVHGGNNINFSMGVGGSERPLATPEPVTVVLFGMGLIGGAVARRKIRVRV